MCEKCGDPKCYGTKEGTTIDSVEFTEKSSQQAIEILDQLRNMCIGINDETGQIQVEGIVKYCLNENTRADKLLLLMIDLFYKYTSYRSQIKSLVEDIKNTPVLKDIEWENSEIPINKTNKKLN